MEHVKDDRPAFYTELDRNGFIRVWQNRPRRPVLCVMGGNGFSRSEEIMWANRAARALSYDGAMLARAHRSRAVGVLIGLVVGGLLMFGGMLALGYQSADQCVNVGPYANVPNG